MQKSEKHTVSIDAVSARLLYYRKCGKEFYLKGDGVIRKSGKEMEFLKYEEAANFFYKSNLSYKSCSRWREAGDSLLRGAWCYERLKAYLVAAATYCEAAETFLKTDQTEAIEAYKSASKLYSNNKKPDIAGTLERKVALLHYSDRNWEEAATHFSKAGMLLEGEAYRNQSDSCFEKKAECYVLHGIELDEASRIYEAIAESCVRSNLRRFNARDYLFKAVLCLFGEPMPEIEADDDDDDVDAVLKEINENSEEKYNSIEWKIHEYEVTDYLWKCSKEALFLKNVVKARLEWNIESFANNLYHWNNVCPLDKVSLILLNVMRKELQDELKRREGKLKFDTEKTARDKLRALKFEEKRAAMELLGIVIEEKDVADELDKELDEDLETQDDEGKAPMR